MLDVPFKEVVYVKLDCVNFELVEAALEALRDDL